jgi:MoaA/NifB/PqqE/SkfB family radical SAM enzyme
LLDFFEIPIGFGRGVVCGRCAASSDSSDSSHYSSEEVLAGVRSVVAREGERPVNVSFVGYEPFAHLELPQLIGGAALLGCARIRLRTDGGALALSGNAAGAMAAGVHHIELVLLAGDSEAHDRLSGVDGLFDAATAGVAAWNGAAADSGTRTAVTGLVPLCRHNIEHAAAAVAHLAACGVVAVRLETSGLDEKHLPTVIAALDTATVNGVAGFVTGPLASRAGVRGIAPWGTSEVLL